MTSSRLVLAFFISASAASGCTAKEVAAHRDSAALADPGSIERRRNADSARSAEARVRIAHASRRFGVTMDSMQAHVRIMRGLSPSAMARMLPRHRRMLDNMLAQMTTDIYSMHIPVDVAWTATMDSLHQDLIQLPELTKPELVQAMPGHWARLSRLMALHKTMMATLQK